MEIDEIINNPAYKDGVHSVLEDAPSYSRMFEVYSWSGLLGQESFCFVTPKNFGKEYSGGVVVVNFDPMQKTRYSSDPIDDIIFNGNVDKDLLTKAADMNGYTIKETKDQIQVIKQYNILGLKFKSPIGGPELWIYKQNDDTSAHANAFRTSDTNAIMDDYIQLLKEKHQ